MNHIINTLEERRVRGDLIEAFKLLKGIAKLDYSLDVRKNFFSNRVVDAWNELPQYVVDAETLNSFKARLDKFYHTI